MEQAGELDRADDLRVEPEPLGEEDRVAGDVLGVALRVAVLRVDRDDEALEDVEADVAASSSASAPGDADRVAAAGLGLLERRATAASRSA